MLTLPTTAAAAATTTTIVVVHNTRSFSFDLAKVCTKRSTKSLQGRGVYGRDLLCELLMGDESEIRTS